MDQVRIDTPEQVALEFPVAGIGSRFLALAIDTLLQVAAAILIALLCFGVLGLGDDLPGVWGSAGPAIGVFLLFLLEWGYFAAFEFFWRGQTPGKRAARIRVIKESGRPLDAQAALLRNLLRAVDFLPGFYGVGIITMIVSRDSRRLGDLAAGTIVVHERPVEATRRAWMASAPDAASSRPATRLPLDELVLIETYLGRRLELDPQVQDATAGKLAERITARTGLLRAPGQSAQDFIEAVVRDARDAGAYH